MKERRDALDTSLLMIEILKRIPKTGKISAPEICESLKDTEYARDLRTIQRHLDTIKTHFHLDCDESTKPYGYRWPRESGGLSLPSLTRQESLVMVMVEAQLKALLPKPVLGAMKDFFGQAKSNLRRLDGPSWEREWLRKVRIVPTTQPLLPAKLKEGVYETVMDALYRNQWLTLDYRNHGGRVTHANVMPLALVHQGSRPYLVVRFEGYEEERLLAIPRIQRVTTLMKTFDYPKDFDVDRFEAQGRMGFGQGQKIRLKFVSNGMRGYT